MSPRRRSLPKRQLPPNLYERRGYYSWRDPRTREEYGLGRHRGPAIAQAVEANLRITSLLHRPRLIDRLGGSGRHTVRSWAGHYGSYLDHRELSAATRRQYASFNRRIVAMLGEQTLVKAVTALQVSEGLAAIVAEGKERTALCFRRFARDWFREAIVQGWCDENPVRDTKIAVRVKVKRARLLLPVFMQVYEAETAQWARDAYALALVSAQRLEDIAEAKFADFKHGGWCLRQASEKSAERHQVFIPNELRLDAFGMSLADVVKQCRGFGQYLIRHRETRGDTRAGAKVWKATISRRFTATLASLGLDFGDKRPPTFHEIRSLSERLYADQGGVATQHLLGHTDAATTALYHDSRGSEWVHALDGRKIVIE